MIISIIIISIMFLTVGSLALKKHSKRQKRNTMILKPYMFLFKNRKYETFSNLKKDLLK